MFSSFDSSLLTGAKTVPQNPTALHRKNSAAADAALNCQLQGSMILTWRISHLGLDLDRADNPFLEP